MFRPKWIDDWFSPILDRSRFHVEGTSLVSSKDWFLSKGAIRHRTGRFFNIVGCQWKDQVNKIVGRPLIEQYEIGTLGFLIRRNSTGRELLVQAKIEPGNVGVIQMAPTCQATASNASRAHGGTCPPYTEYFAPGDTNIVYESLQSEQGTRFLGKRNRNVLRMVDHPVITRVSHKWLSVQTLLDLIPVDFLINTDARSVLVSCPWEELVDRPPFSRYESGFGVDLLHSLQATSQAEPLEEICSEIRALRNAADAPEIVPLERLKEWTITETGVEPRSGGSFCVRQINVEANGREVSAWNQPIADSRGEGRVELICGRIDGVLHFLFRPYPEPGLYHRVELGPTLVREPGCRNREENTIDYTNTIVRAECRQSEEGGRFFQDTNLHRLVDVGEAFEAPRGYHWLTLAQIRKLLDESGWLTNEGRCVLGLLLPWL